VALDYFLAASLFCNEDRRSSSNESRFSKHCSIGAVSGNSFDGGAQCGNFSLDGEGG
jgi:hypothetical protein